MLAGTNSDCGGLGAGPLPDTFPNGCNCLNNVVFTHVECHHIVIRAWVLKCFIHISLFKCLGFKSLICGSCTGSMMLRYIHTLLKMTHPSWDPNSFYLGLIPYRTGTQHPNSKRDPAFLGKRSQELSFFFRTKAMIRKNYIVGIF